MIIVVEDGVEKKYNRVHIPQTHIYENNYYGTYIKALLEIRVCNNTGKKVP